MTWTPAQMADVLQGFLGDKRIHYELLACFGANSWGLASSFAEKLAADMRGANMRGTLTALKGATNIGAGQGRQTGTSRITTGMKMPWKVHGKVIKPGGTDPRGPLSSDSTVKWNLT